MTAQRKQTGRTGSPRLSLTARAVRAALFVSALAGAPAAFAGTCTQTATNEVTCTGVFTDNVTNSIPVVNLVPNLSLILDDTTTVDPATGVEGLTASWGGNVGVLSYADINTVGADGIHLYGSTSGTLSSYGDITTEVTAAGNNAIDASAFGSVNAVVGGNVYAYNDAALNVITTSFDSINGNVNLLVDDTGNIGAYAYDGDAIAVYVDAFSGATTTVDGALSATSAYGNAAGLINSATYGNSHVYNTGSISADAYGDANGAVSGSKYGFGFLVNGGDISATAYAGNAVGALAYGGNGAYIGNAGDISADSTYGAAIGAFVYAGTGDLYFYNSGTVSATGYDQAAAVGLLAGTGNVYAGNYGSLTASASGDLTATATGLYADGALVGFNNTGDISASADTAGVGGTAYATALAASGSTDVFVNNSGSLYAYASGDHAYATGADLAATNLVSLDNSGSISAYAYGAYSIATGVSASSTGAGIVLTNDGDITATADYAAIGVDLTSDTYVDIYNTGTIAAYGGYYSIAIDTSGGLSADTIMNYGTITGAIYTGAGDDYLYNGVGATWNASGYSGFGDGDDTVYNAGTINMTNASISLGGYATAAGNVFDNTGTINLDGANYVDVGAGGGASASLFTNDGVLDFQDGAADDSLTIYGDFAGTGDINVDVEGNAGVSDYLYIDGNVAAGTSQTINVDLIDLSAPIAGIIPIVGVSGDSVAGNFQLGDVNWDSVNSFVDLDFSLVADIDTTNATPDVFGLGIAVSGLSDTGTIAASLAPGVQSLMTSQVGTWRQRMGVIDQFNKGGVSLWARVFQDKATFSPEFISSDIGPGGNFDWKQRNRGVEAGIDFAVTDEFSLGLLAAKSKADNDLDPGNASASIDADTWGIYGTWLSPEGFYLDTSYRWTKFDTDLSSIAGPMKAKGKAETFNVELGYAWTMASGLKIEPQFQWTKTNVKDIDLFTTTSGMTFRADGGDSSRGRLGVAVYKGFGDAETGWRVTPYGALSAVREFDGENDFAINDTLVGRTTTKGTSGLLELGVTARHEGLSIYGGLNWQDGGAIKSSIGGQLGVRYTFGGASPAPAPARVAVAAPAPKTCADLDDDGDGVNNCDDKCMGSTAGQAVGPDGCPVPAPEPEPVMAPKPYRN